MKIGLLITARLKSTRLPFKLLMDLNGRTLIERVIDRSKTLHNIEQIVLCTSTNPQDKPLTDIALRNNIHYFLGNEQDVLKRLLDASKFFSFDYILSITGENPLFSISYANRTLDVIKREKPDFVLYEGLPIGCAIYGLNVKALEVVCEVKKEVDTEIWGPLINRPEIFDVHIEKVNPFYNRPLLRVTCDYFEDYRLLNSIFKNYSVDQVPSLYDALGLLDSNPELLQINAKNKQASLSEEKIREINEFFKKNNKRIGAIKDEIYLRK